MSACSVLISATHYPLNQLEIIFVFLLFGQNTVVLGNNICEIASSKCRFYFVTSAAKHTNYNMKCACGSPHSILYATSLVKLWISGGAHSVFMGNVLRLKLFCAFLEKTL